MNAGWGISPWNLVDFNHEIWWISTMKSGGFYLWNPPKIIKASVSAKTLQFDECRVGDFTLEIQWISPWNLVDFNHEIWWISPRFHLWNPPKIIKASVSAKTLQFDECRVGDFTLEIHQISPWNLADFTQISPVKSTQNYKSKCFSKNSSVWWMQGGGYDQGFHEIHPEIWWISPMKSGRFHPDFTCEIHPNDKSKCFSKNSSVWWMQGGGYDQGFHEIHPEIWWISPMKSGRFHPDFTCEIHPNDKSKCFSKNSSVWWMQGGGFHPRNPVDFTLKSGGFQPWNLVDFTQISPVKSTQNYKSKCFSKNSSVWWMQGGGYDQGFHEIRMKSAGFHVKSKDLLQGIVTLCFITCFQS